MTPDVATIHNRVREKSWFIDTMFTEIHNVVIGQNNIIERLCIGLLADGHILLEGMPGLAKTLTIKTLATMIDARFNRVQFTPDLLPADIIGTLIYNPTTHSFDVKKGPVFTNVLLADEINRAPAKVQSALLEAMQERNVTIGDTTFPLPRPFWVLATQNPIDQEGTYPLPEAQIDRFLMKVVVDYPTMDEELRILRTFSGNEEQSVSAVISQQEILKSRELVRQIYIDEKIERYILELVFATRTPNAFGLNTIAPYISFGGSPRATLSLALASKAMAFIKRRGFVVPEDVRSLAFDVLRHRIGLTYTAEAENITTDYIITTILDTISVP